MVPIDDMVEIDGIEYNDTDLRMGFYSIMTGTPRDGLNKMSQNGVDFEYGTHTWKKNNKIVFTVLNVCKNKILNENRAITLGSVPNLRNF